MTATLQFSGISKHFPGVKALDDVSFSVAAGAVHGLMGENGAGKSTLLKILGGQYVPNAGSILIDGQPQAFRNARDAIAAGIAIIHQELQYVPDMTVADNLLLGHYPARFGFVRRGAALATVRAALQRIGVDIDPLVRLRQLSIAQRQMVEICKAVMRDARIIAFDEPTSSLSHRETEILFRLVRRLQADGHALIYISHRMDEIYALCDSCTIFRDGRRVASHARLADVGRDTMIREMVGRDIADIYNYRPRPLGPVRLQARGIAGPGLSAPADFAVRGGEILGFFGLVGAGRSELMRLVAGVTATSGGALELDGVPVHVGNVRQAIRQGIVFCPEDRKEEGIVGALSVSENINISCRRHDRRWGFFVDDGKEAATAERYIDLLKIKTPSRRQEIRFLSGGNQQKAILSRWLAEVGVKVLIVDEPTRGIDVGAKNDIYAVLYALAEQGCAIIMISSELPEVLGVADRVVVMRQGRIVGELARADGDQDKLLQLALPVAETAAADATPTH